MRSFCGSYGNRESGANEACSDDVAIRTPVSAEIRQHSHGELRFSCASLLSSPRPLSSRSRAGAISTSPTCSTQATIRAPGHRALRTASATAPAATHRRLPDGFKEQAIMRAPGKDIMNSIARAVQAAREKYPQLEIEVEADSLADVRAAAEAGVEYILLDNMSDDTMREAVRLVSGRAKLEASGGITIERLHRIAGIGVDFVSIGALTHSVKSADISLDIEVVK